MSDSAGHVLDHQSCPGLPAIARSALFNPNTSILIKKRHSYTGNLNSETPGDSKNAFLHWGDVLGQTSITLTHCLSLPNACGAFRMTSIYTMWPILQPTEYVLRQSTCQI